MPGKFVIYTCITGAYDPLQQPVEADGRFSYICYVGPGEKHGERDGVWEIRELPADAVHPVLASRMVKIRPHLYLPEFDHSLYM
ncbi:MAG: hypothetical protein J5871_02750, partial [Bacteroidales bacterium]|nr:hypothetical protein [Bacteroidales bacterium]